MTTLPNPRFANPRDAPTLRWGIVGPGAIANDFTRVVLAHTTQEVVAVSSRSSERAALFAAAHGIRSSYGSHDELFADPGIDVVYIAVPHTEHVRLALDAIAAGKHVLVEKPMATTAADAKRVVNAARAAGVFAMEALWAKYLPKFDVIRQLLDDGALGDVRLFSADYGFKADYNPGSRFFNPELGGGALLDLGVYLIATASFALGEFSSVTARGQLSPTGVDVQASLLLETAAGAQAVMSTTLLADTPGQANIVGTHGRIAIDRVFVGPGGFTFSPAGGNPVRFEDTSGLIWREGLSYQASAVARYISEGRTESPLHSLDETLSVLRTLDEARRQVRDGGSIRSLEAQ
ncbi:Gfo/Idh/MocA family protein [Mycetocola zhadangensis]|uniref:Gfo/Idh/MocA family oxidoreductase n=1 Tax=Mycetocola zhadangensis TaxID=1164595 RepID=A0A3L7IS16_9MICO|nr:Gfo/Idh/MocA family oxidoreductase [Mycetocola zhadangensis]RLQ80994.1 gfo/Idh/MocA family oxidoreductase [Mycetocola zhadangensis]GGF03825.1 oxidoreductase [Mycetocola zhadangensis]